jgi:hypothetical protein
MSSQGGSIASFPGSTASAQASMEILTGDLRSRTSEPRRRDSVETPAQPVRLGGNRHVRAVRESLAVVVAVLVVIAGLGFAGGHLPNGLAGLARTSARPSASSRATSVPSASPEAPTTAPATSGPVAQVTPVVPCSAPRATSPDPMLAIAGRGRYEGETTYVSDLAPGAVETTEPNQSLQISADDVVALIFVDHRCALAWDIAIDGGRVFSHQDNPNRDPAYAAQNQFPLQFGARAYSATLTATFRFATGESRTVWHIQVVGFEPPAVALGELAAVDGAGAEVIMAPGCGFQLSLRNGAVLADACATELPQTELPVIEVQPGTTLVFFGPVATFDPVGPIRCGHAVGEPPFLDSDLLCVLEVSSTDPAQFQMPAEPGRWLIGMGGCVRSDGNEACGSWFAIVDTTGTAPTTAPSI